MAMVSWCYLNLITLNLGYKRHLWRDIPQSPSKHRGTMVFSKTFLVLLLAILGTSWIPDGRTNGLASACWSRATRPVRCEQKNDPKVATAEVPTEVLSGVTKQVPSIDGIPQEYDEFAPLTVGLWIENKYYQLPNARYYKVEFKEGTSRSLTHVPNPFYHGGPIIIKD